MKMKSYLILLAILLLSFSLANAKTTGTAWGYGLEGGLAIGDNAGNDEVFVPMGRAHIQYQISKAFFTRLGIGYTQLKATDVYETKTLSGDIRLLVRPLQMNLLSPYFYAGIGLAKNLDINDSNNAPIVPFGIGFQTRISSKLALEISGGYNLALSDDLDGRIRTSEMNRFTNDKHDGYFNLSVGVVFTHPKKNVEPKPEPPVAVTPVEKEPFIDPNTVDTDNDGITDAKENSVYHTNPNKADTDGDGINDNDEINKYKTDPNKADTDNDGLSDNDEINRYKSDPLKTDTDNDGLSDGDEVNVYRTNPVSIDTDGGGLNDGAEIKAGKNPLVQKDDIDVPIVEKKAEPVVAPPVRADIRIKDTDNDGINDVDETQKYHTDPLKADTDGDGLSDGDEILKYRTDALVTDTDKDGLSDGLEVNQYKTDPLKADTDGDGLNDYAEVMTYRTDPLKIDSDGGGMNDGAEIQAKKNPLDAKDDLLDMSKGKKVVLDGIVFASGKATIMGGSETILEKVYESLKANPEVNVLITGHTDSVGDENSNRELSTKRAQAVKDWLTDKGISGSRIKVIGKGEAEPVATNANSDGRAQNRRIEFEVQN